MEPLTVISTISLGLKLVDQFRELTLGLIGKTPTPPSTTVEQSGDALQVRRSGAVVQTMPAKDMPLDQFDEVRYKALNRRIKFNWELYNELFGQLPELSVDERARIKGRLNNTKAELCEDFREMVKIYERAIGSSLPDHYTLYEVCGPV
jgi:hypothetical protein